VLSGMSLAPTVVRSMHREPAGVTACLHEGIERTASPRRVRTLAVSDGPDDATRPAPPVSARSRLRVVGPNAYGDWDEIYADNVVWIYRLLFSKVGNRPDAEDLTTEVFLAALGPLRVSATRPEVRGYLAATARTTLARYWRNRLGVQITTIDPELAVGQRDEPGISSGTVERARTVLAQLPDRHRRVLELRFLESRSIRETAQQMGISVANAKVLQHRALRIAARADHGGKP
jgi:RNA polymerase sigma-70 factor, ECF subfamily